MKYLLDTHTFLWWDMEASKLSARVFEIFQDTSHTLMLSVASVWEIQIKQKSGKLKLTSPLPEIIEKQQRENEITLLPINLVHVLELENLPAHHNDPFDRILIAQARVENVTLLSNDSVFTKYTVNMMW